MAITLNVPVQLVLPPAHPAFVPAKQRSTTTARLPPRTEMRRGSGSGTPQRAASRAFASPFAGNALRGSGDEPPTPDRPFRVAGHQDDEILSPDAGLNAAEDSPYLHDEDQRTEEESALFQNMLIADASQPREMASSVPVSEAKKGKASDKTRASQPGRGSESDPAERPQGSGRGGGAPSGDGGDGPPSGGSQGGGDGPGRGSGSGGRGDGGGGGGGNNPGRGGGGGGGGRGPGRGGGGDGGGGGPPGAFIELPEGMRNGPEQVGIAAGADVCKDPELALVFDRVNPGLVAYANVGPRLLQEGNDQAANKHNAVVRLCVYAIAQWGWHCGDASSNVIQYDPAVHVPANADMIDAVQADLETGGVSWEDVATIIASTKVAFYQMNHHVGTGVYAGFAAKVARVHFGDRADDFKSAHWAIGHMASTRGMLHGMNVRGIFVDDLQLPDVWPDPTRDITIRLEAAPAGTAKLMDTAACLDKAARTLYSVAFDVVADAADIAEGRRAVQENPIAYHVGARYLTREDRIDPYVPDDETMIQAAAFIHAYQPNGTLARNRALPPASEVSGTVLYGTVQRIKAALVTQPLRDEEIRRLTSVGGANRLAGYATAAGVHAWQPAVEEEMGAEALQEA